MALSYQYPAFLHEGNMEEGSTTAELQRKMSQVRYPLPTPHLIAQWKEEEDLETGKKGHFQGEHHKGKYQWEKLSWLGDVRFGKKSNKSKTKL
ncbi:hypothetical protein MC885_015566 [Smutsia gigantea]|nr:hypothetical protein MC885_015566 [Smutsia gigantea]